MATKGKGASTDRREGWTQEAEPISRGDRKAVLTLLSALTPISDLRERPIPLPFAVVFLSVVLNEGQPVGRYGLGIEHDSLFHYPVHSIYWRSRTPGRRCAWVSHYQTYQTGISSEDSSGLDGQRPCGGCADIWQVARHPRLANRLRRTSSGSLAMLAMRSIPSKPARSPPRSVLAVGSRREGGHRATSAGQARPSRCALESAAATAWRHRASARPAGCRRARLGTTRARPCCGACNALGSASP